MVDPPAKSPLVLREGVPVEVTSNEEGFGGAWYRATIAELPPKSSSKKKKKVLVKYDTLVTEDGTASLTEYVDRDFIRPLPPDEGGSGDFVENDVVDAGYRDGWWTGVIKKVLQNSRYRVYFDNPPDIMEFEKKDLRPRHEWVAERWMRSFDKGFSRQHPSRVSMFSSGADVEVKVETMKAFFLWVPAIVIGEYENNTFLVKYEDSTTGDGDSVKKIFVDSSRIRPPPPGSEDRLYNWQEPVEAMYDFGWRPGIIDTVLNSKRFTVSFENGNFKKDFDHSEIRPLLEWVKGKWTKAKALSNVKVNFIASDIQEVSLTACDGGENSEKGLKIVSSSGPDDDSDKKSLSAIMEIDLNSPSTPLQGPGAALAAKNANLAPCSGGAGISLRLKKYASEPLLTGSPSRIRKMLRETSTKTCSTVPKRKVRMRDSVKPVNVDPVNRQLQYDRTYKRKQPSEGFQSLVTCEEATVVIDTSEGKYNREQRAREHGSHVVLGIQAQHIKDRPQAVIHGEISDGVESKGMMDVNDYIHGSLGDIKRELKQKRNGGSSQKRKRGRPRKFVNPGISAARDTSNPNVDEAHETDSKTRKVDKAAAEASNSIPDDDQPLSTWIAANHSNGAEDLKVSAVRSVREDNGMREKRMDVIVEPSDKRISVVEEGQSLPFVKRSPIWNSIESMQVFRIVPQRAHFFPLNKMKEGHREGAAIGILVNFANMFDQITNLQPDDPKSIFDNLIESLIEMEEHGFDVAALRGRINELLLIKENREQLISEKRDNDAETAAHAKKRMKSNEDVLEIRKKIAELELQLAVAKSEMETEDVEVTTRQARGDALIDQIQNVDNEFRRVAAAPWKE